MRLPYSSCIPMVLLRLLVCTLGDHACYGATEVSRVLSQSRTMQQQQSFMSVKDAPLISVGLHFPPLAYDPNLGGSTQKGLLREIYYQAFAQHGLRIKSQFYPPSRMVKVIRDGDADMFSSDIRVAQQYRSTYNCNLQPLYYLVLMLYQNTSMHKQHYKQPKSELKQARLLVPRESKHIFARIIDSSNILLPIVLPHNMSRMFSVQREAFMIDYKGRAQAALARLQPQFDIQQYLLGEAATVICLNKQIDNSQAILAALHHTIRSYQNTPFLNNLEQKYQFEIQWQAALPQFVMPSDQLLK